MTTITANNLKADPLLVLRKGFLITSTDVSGTAATEYDNVGKTFGIFGEGKATLPENTKGFRYKELSTAVNFAYISIFPSKHDATVANTINFKVRSVDFMALTDFDPPV